MSAPLNSLTTGSYHKLEWRQLKGMQRDSELKADDRALGTMTFRSMFGTLATAKIGDDCFTFKRVGFFQQRVEVRECDSADPVAEFLNATWKGGGTLLMRSGKTFRATSNLWNTKWEVQDDQGRVLLRFDYGGVFKLSAKVKVMAPARQLAELPLLIALSWYLVVMLAADAAASAAVIG
jgi:hypothetical protein